MIGSSPRAVGASFEGVRVQMRNLLACFERQFFSPPLFDWRVACGQLLVNLGRLHGATSVLNPWSVAPTILVMSSVDRYNAGSCYAASAYRELPTYPLPSQHWFAVIG